MATVAPIFSSMPPLLCTHPLCPVMSLMPPDIDVTISSASARPDTRTAGGHERQKPLVLPHGTFVYLIGCWQEETKRGVGSMSVSTRGSTNDNNNNNSNAVAREVNTSNTTVYNDIPPGYTQVHPGV